MGKYQHKAAYISFRCPPEIEDTISRIAAEQRKTKSEVLRQLVDAGLVATGYRQDDEYLDKKIREAVAAELKPSVERLASISAKAAQISGAAFFMSVYMGQLVLPASEQDLVREVAADARKLGIEYLKLKDRDVDDFIATGVKKILDS